MTDTTEHTLTVELCVGYTWGTQATCTCGWRGVANAAHTQGGEDDLRARHLTEVGVEAN